MRDDADRTGWILYVSTHWRKEIAYNMIPRYLEKIGRKKVAYFP